MNIQNNILDVIPVDLLHEIFSRLPAKSVGRWRCVSKKLASILGSEDFKQLFLTRSLTRPCLLLIVDKQNEYWSAVYSLRQPQNEKSSLVRTAECPRLSLYDSNYASGLCISSTFMYEEEYISIVISNPSTGQYVILPDISELGFKYCPKTFLGFDPIDKQFKILLMYDGVNGFILTLGTGKMRWRTIKCSLLPDDSNVYPTGICINGVLYYLARACYDIALVIVCFDVRTETFKSKFLVSTTQDRFPELINCNGKLGITILREGVNSVELDMWVVEEDVEKPEWSKYTLPIINANDLSVVGMTSRGEIILFTLFTKPDYLYYFNLEKNSHQSVEVQGSENHDYGWVIIDHVEDLYVNDAKYFKSHIDANPRQAPPRESINTFEEVLCLSDEEDDD